MPPGYTSSAKQQPKKPSNKSRNKPPQTSQPSDGSPQKPPSQPKQQQKPRQQANRGQVNKPPSQSTDDKPQVPQISDEDKKKVSAIRKKLKDIKILKEKQEKGEKLDNNQLKKIESEGELNKELAALKLS